MALTRKRLLLTLTTVLFASASSYVLLREGNARAAQRELAAIIPQIASVTLYDLDSGDPLTPDSLSSAISAPFPADVFVRAASSAEHHSGITVWKGSSLAVLTLRDGTQRRAHFSYYGGFFTIEGASGRFAVPEASSSDFHQRYMRFIQEQFVPQRIQRNKTRSA